MTIETLQNNVLAILGERVVSSSTALGELTIHVKPADYPSVALQLRDQYDC